MLENENPKYPYVSLIMQVLAHTPKVLEWVRFKLVDGKLNSENPFRKNDGLTDSEDIYLKGFFYDFIKGILKPNTPDTDDSDYEKLNITEFCDRLIPQLPRLKVKTTREPSILFLNRLLIYLQLELQRRNFRDEFWDDIPIESRIIKEFKEYVNTDDFFNPFTVVQVDFGISTYHTSVSPFESSYSLSLGRNKSRSLVDCLEIYRNHLYRLPEIFIITLNKENDYLKREDSNKFTFVIPTVLDLNDYMYEPQETSLDYALYAVITRLPNNTYIATVLIDGLWYRFDEITPPQLVLNLDIDDGNIRYPEIMKGSIFFYAKKNQVNLRNVNDYNARNKSKKTELERRAGNELKRQEAEKAAAKKYTPLTEEEIKANSLLAMGNKSTRKKITGGHRRKKKSRRRGRSHHPYASHFEHTVMEALPEPEPALVGE